LTARAALRNKATKKLFTPPSTTTTAAFSPGPVEGDFSRRCTIECCLFPNCPGYLSLSRLTIAPNAMSYRGALRLKLGQSEFAEADFRDAITMAQRMNAKAWELRAAMSMARLWRDQDKRQQAHDLLAPVYGWFTEGFDTLDLKEAKALLEELA
jgi:hypothetical protein